MQHQALSMTPPKQVAFPLTRALLSNWLTKTTQMPSEQIPAAVQGVIDNDPRRALELNERIYLQGTARAVRVLNREVKPVDLIEDDLLNIREEITGELQ